MTHVFTRCWRVRAIGDGVIDTNTASVEVLKHIMWWYSIEISSETYDTIELLDASCSIFYSGHLDETKTARSVGLLSYL